MPELSRFYGIVVALFYRDHSPPHIHVFCGGSARSPEYEAKIRISDGRVISGRIPSGQLKLVQAWAYLHQDALYKAWEDAMDGIRPGKIPPLK